VTLAFSLVLIFILFLVDKHNLWRQALKLSVRLVASVIILALLAWGGIIGWGRYSEWQERRNEQKREAAHKAKVTNCVLEHMRGTASVYSAAGVSADDLKRGWTKACEADPDTTQQNPFANTSATSMPVIEIGGGETLHIKQPHQPGFTPIVYLGHHQKLAFLCGDYGESGTPIADSKGGDISCP
jgi:hypothetical protein